MDEISSKYQLGPVILKILKEIKELLDTTKSSNYVSKHHSLLAKIRLMYKHENLSDEQFKEIYVTILKEFMSKTADMTAEDLTTKIYHHALGHIITQFQDPQFVGNDLANYLATLPSADFSWKWSDPVGYKTMIEYRTRSHEYARLKDELEKSSEREKALQEQLDAAKTELDVIKKKLAEVVN